MTWEPDELGKGNGREIPNIKNSHKSNVACWKHINRDIKEDFPLEFNATGTRKMEIICDDDRVTVKQYGNIAKRPKGLARILLNRM